MAARDIRKEFAARMLASAQQFRRELAADDQTEGVVEADRIRVTNDAGGVRIAFFEVTGGGSGKKADAKNDADNGGQ